MVEEKSVVPRLACRDLRHRYGAVPVLRGINFKLDKGQTLAIMGKSGSGKSTLLRCLNLLEQPFDGEVALEGQVYLRNGRALFDLSQIRSRVGMVFQDYNLFPNMTCLRNLTLALEKVHSVCRLEAEERAIQMGRRLGIDSLLSRYPETLSGGQAQRLALARALVLQPSVLLLDEITAALDPESIAKVVGTIRQIRQLEEGRHLAIVLVTHLLPLAISFADYIAYISQGLIVDEHPARQFVDLAVHTDTRSFIKRSMELGNEFIF